MPTVIAVDAMGSDRAPKPEVEGAILAVRQFDVRVLLVGQEERLRAELALHPAAARMPLEVVHASEVISMEEKASKAVRAKRDTSMRVGLRLVRDGKAAGFVTAGNTGAAMALAKVVLGALPGVDRPALAGAFPTEAGHAALLLDVGANVDSKPHNLAQFAIMGETYARVIFGRRKPRVGLLSIGEEEVKGNELTRETLPLLKQLPLHFVGNVEGRDLFRGTVDVMVCDGFTGNVALKISEGVGQMVRSMLRQSLESTIASKVGYLLSRRAFEDFRRRLDHAEYGGAPLLGVKGACIITHGSSNNNAIKNAIRVAAEFVSGGVNARIEREIAAMAGKTAVTH